jgi:hypothetical protein
MSKYDFGLYVCYFNSMYTVFVNFYNISLHMIGIYSCGIDTLLALATSEGFLRIKPTDAQWAPIGRIGSVLWTIVCNLFEEVLFCRFWKIVCALYPLHQTSFLVPTQFMYTQLNLVMSN